MRAQKNTVHVSNVPRAQGPRVRVEDDVGRVRRHQVARVQRQEGGGR